MMMINAVVEYYARRIVLLKLTIDRHEALRGLYLL